MSRFHVLYSRLELEKCEIEELVRESNSIYSKKSSNIDKFFDKKIRLFSQILVHCALFRIQPCNEGA